MIDETQLPEIGDLVQQVNSQTGHRLTGLVIRIKQDAHGRYRIQYLCLGSLRQYGIDWRSYTGKYWKIISKASLTSE